MASPSASDPNRTTAVGNPSGRPRLLAEEMGPKWAAYVLVGFTFGALAVFRMPYLFGPIAILAGAKLYLDHDELHGLCVAAWGSLGLFAGLLIWVATSV